MAGDLTDSRWNRRSGLGRIVWPAFIVLLALLPFIFRATAYADYLTYVVVRMMIFGLYAMSYDLLFGFSGIFSFGHAVFLGGGSYLAAIFMSRLGFQDAFPVMLLALVLGLVLGWIMGFLSSRVGVGAVFLVTFALGEMTQLICMSNPLGLTNGENGIAGVVRKTVFGFLNIKPETNFYYFVLIVLGLSYLALLAITNLPLGDVFRGLKGNALRVRFLGYSVRQYQIASFMISGAFSSLAGVLAVLHERAVAPDIFAWVISADAVLFTVVGGPGTLIGPVLGASLVVFFQEVLSDMFRNWIIFLGLSYIALIMFLPNGLFPLLKRIWLRRE
ncbi:MAG: branched-chain amino acid ABC transporter permease [Thermodesulfobacteriota bacterium]